MRRSSDRGSCAPRHVIAQKQYRSDGQRKAARHRCLHALADREADRRRDARSGIEQAGRVDEVAARNQPEETEGRTDRDRQRESERQQHDSQLPRCENCPKPRRRPGNSISNCILQREHDLEGLQLSLLRPHPGRNPEGPQSRRRRIPSRRNASSVPAGDDHRQPGERPGRLGRPGGGHAPFDQERREDRQDSKQRRQSLVRHAIVQRER